MPAENKSVQEFDVLPSGIRPDDIFYAVRANLLSSTGYSDYQVAASELFSTSLTYAAAAALITAENLVPGTVYEITDAVTSGSIFLIANTTTTFYNQGVWAYETSLKSFGSIEITSGASGGISTITVNGVNILPAPVSYTTSRTVTATAVAASINTTSGSTGYTAYGINQAIVIQANVAGTAANTFVISGTTSGAMVLGNSNAMANGAASTTRNITIEYDFTENQIYSAHDLEEDITFTVSQVIIDFLGYNPILTFRWGDKSAPAGAASAFVGCIISNTDFTNCFTINSSFSGSIIDASDFESCLWVDSTVEVVEMSATSDFHLAVFDTCTFNRAVFENAQFDESYFANCNFRDSELSQCRFDDSYITSLTANDVIFHSYTAMQASTITNPINCQGSQIMGGVYNLCLTSPTLTGASGLGLVDVSIPLFVVPDNFFSTSNTIQSNTLTSGGAATLKIGIASDAPDCILPATPYATLNSNKVITSDPTSSTAIRNIAAVPETATITGGTFRVWISGKIEI